MTKKYPLQTGILATVMLILSAPHAFAANFSIVPSGSLPTSITPGQTVSASYVITNLTSTTRNGYTIQGLPSSVTYNSGASTCGNPINLAALASCIIQLDISAAVTTSFAICKGNSCTTTSTPLKVTNSTAPSFPKFAYITNNGASGGAMDPTVLPASLIKPQAYSPPVNRQVAILR